MEKLNKAIDWVKSLPPKAQVLIIFGLVAIMIV